MPTQDERLTALEKYVTENIDDIKHNETMLLGLAFSHQQDIRQMSQRLETVQTRLGTVETTLNEHTTILNQHTALLTQILERLPKNP
ncbi:MAG TPA: hypothetical protein VHZ51_22340 [Ktedonobacteraceae bacterium]|jgi:division protein CdvB (Snf7/Vps24/ESCRT-III family)|nr:hypothetical protein [Ktedonobacteraceae bacterium]